MMLRLDDEKWASLYGGYRVPVDIPGLLRALEEAREPQVAWSALWDQLLHQGTSGVGSVAAVPHLVRIHQMREGSDWNVYALVAAIDAASQRQDNPSVPDWLQSDYKQALEQLATQGLSELPTATDPQTAHSILAVLSIAFGIPVYGHFMTEFTEDEVREVLAN